MTAENIKSKATETMSTDKEKAKSPASDERVQKANTSLQIDSVSVVRSVLYAVVVSAWVSVISNKSESVHLFIQWLGKFLKPLCESGNHCAAFMSIGVFAFLTLYFHDEWKYRGTAVAGYPREELSVLCIGWSFFLFQVCLLGTSLAASSVCGIFGVAIISGGFFHSLGFSGTLKNHFFLENVAWIVVMIVFLLIDSFGIRHNWSVWLLLLPVAFPLLRFCLPWGLPPS